MIDSGFSGSLPYRMLYFISSLIVLTPIQVLILAIFHKDYAYDFRFRIFGHYKSNFSFQIAMTDYLLFEILSAIFDFLLVILPFEKLLGFMIGLEGRVLSESAYNDYQVVVL